jgi:hypothetical protein
VRTATKMALALVACAATGCSLQTARPAGDVTLTVTRDFGSRPVLDQPDPERAADDTVAQLLSSNAHASPRGWSVFVNGVASSPGARVRSDDHVWWDRHDQTAATRIPAVVGAYPEPFRHGLDGRRLPVRIDCGDPGSAACRAVGDALGRTGVVAGENPIGGSVGPEVLRVAVGEWRTLRSDTAVRSLERGPAVSGVYTRVSGDGRSLAALDPRGRVARRLGAGTGLIAATDFEGQQPVWIVSGTDARGLDAAVRAFAAGQSVLAGKFALAISADRAIELPVTRR